MFPLGRCYCSLYCNCFTVLLFRIYESLSTKAIQKVNNVCAYSSRICFVAADHWFLVFSVMLKISSCSCTLDLVMWSTETAVAMAVPIENPADCDVRGVIRFLQADQILCYLSEEASSRVELFCCTTMHDRILPGRHKPCCVSNSIGTSSSILRTVGPGTVGLSCLQKWSTLLVNASQMMKNWRMLSAATWYEEGIHKLVPRYDKCLNVKGD